ncbi:MAG: hypothetical protein AAFY57_11415 [Cyanobacteria bacterium J06642_2]
MKDSLSVNDDTALVPNIGNSSTLAFTIRESFDPISEVLLLRSRTTILQAIELT